MNENRGPWYLLTGLLIGLAIGIFFSWRIQPLEYTDTTPGSLGTEFKDKYRALIASAYLANGDLVRAKARLELLGDEDVARVLAEQAQRTLAEGSSPDEAHALGQLAVALGAAPGPGVAVTQIPATPTAAGAGLAVTPPLPSQTPVAGPVSLSPVSQPIVPDTGPVTDAPTPEELTSTSGANPSPSATPAALFVLKTREAVCDPGSAASLIRVLAFDASGSPLPGVQVIVAWAAGEERFFTGLKPEIGPGYADFRLTPGETYSLRLGESGKPIAGLTAPDCQTAAGAHYWGGWQLTFERSP